MSNNITIIGAGFTGILSSLLLHRNFNNLNINLCDKNNKIGGRVVFNSLMPNKRTGLDINILNYENINNYLRLLKQVLTEEENEIFSNIYLTNNNISKTYIVKKEFTESTNLLSLSSEIFTKKEAETFCFLLDLDKILKIEESNNIKFSAHYIWKNLTTSMKDSLLPLFETIICRGFLDFDVKNVSFILNNMKNYFFSNSLLLLNNNFFWEFIENILEKRKINIFLSTNINKIIKIKNGNKLFITAGKKNWEADKVILTAPLISALSFLDRDYFSATQSKWISKNQPWSLVVVEYQNFNDFCLPHVPKLNYGDKLLFPTERVVSFITEDNTLICYIFLPYEDYLQAPNVKDAVNKIRKSAARLFNDTCLKGLSGKYFDAINKTITEKIVLIPAAKYLNSTIGELFDIQMGIKNLFLCGDGFNFAKSPLENINSSVCHLFDKFKSEL